jgi:hypothetical protein
MSSETAQTQDRLTLSEFICSNLLTGYKCNPFSGDLTDDWWHGWAFQLKSSGHLALIMDRYWRERFGDTTYASELPSRYSPLSKSTNLLTKALEVSARHENKGLRDQAISFLLALQEVLSFFDRSHGDLDDLAPLWPVALNDGSILFEWIFQHYRIGFSIEPDPEASSWYLVADEDLGGISASGQMSGIDVRSLLRWLITFVAFRS